MLYVPYVIVGLGVLIAVLRVAGSFQVAIQHDKFTDQVIKLAQADNLDRVRKLAGAVDVPYTRIIGAVVDAVGMVPKTDFGQRMEAARATFQRYYEAESRKLRATIPLALIGVVLLLVAPLASAALGRPLDLYVLVPAGVGILLMLRYALSVRAVLVDSQREFKRAFPAIVGRDGL